MFALAAAGAVAVCLLATWASSGMRAGRHRDRLDWVIYLSAVGAFVFGVAALVRFLVTRG